MSCPQAYLKINHSCQYFFDEISRVGERDYMPSDQDMLFLRRPTTGIIEQKWPGSSRDAHN